MALLAETSGPGGHWSSSHEDEKIPVGSISSAPDFVARRKPQYLAALIPTLGSFSLGTVLAWSSPALPDLAERQDLGPLSSKAKSWIASLAVLGALISGPITGFLINRFGRKRTMLCFAIPFVLGWALIIFAQNLTMMGAGRMITGFCGGSFTVAVPVYIFEAVEDHLRGLLGSAMVLMLVTGILFAKSFYKFIDSAIPLAYWKFTVAAFVSWFWLSVICAHFPVLFFIAMLFLPETPRFLLLQGKTKKATLALKWLRGATVMEEIEPELMKLRNSVDAGKDSDSGVPIMQLLKPAVLKPTGISVALMFFQQLGGINAVCFYTVDILRAANPHFDANVASIIIGVVQVIFVLTSMFLVDRFGRKIFLVTSDVIMALSLTALGLFFYLKQETERDTQSTSMAFVPLVSLISFIIAYSAGAGPLPWLLMGEILPPNVKGMASGIVTSVYWFLAFVATKTFDNLIALLQNHGCYWLYAAVCAAGAVFTVLVVPETKGKSSEEIQRYFGAEIPGESKQGEALFSDERLSYHDQKAPDIFKKDSGYA